MTENSVFEEIEWPEQPDRLDDVSWAQTVQAVKILCGLGEVTQWLNVPKGKDGYTHMPYKYDIDDVKVEFLPHWGYYSVGGRNLDVPTDAQNVLDAVQFVNGLIGLGFNRHVQSNR